MLLGYVGTLNATSFKIEVKSQPLTRRGLLSVVCSLYDPLGFVASIVLPAKVILQDLCRKNLEWDDPIPDNERNSWLSWLEDLQKLEQLSVDRCLKPPSFGKVVSVQLHHFSDTLQQGYGAVSYLRFLDDKDPINCSFVMGKAVTAPLKTVTIPRLELSAAVVASRLDKILRKEIDIPVDESVFWTDSTCVITYIQNNEKRFHTFVANRIAIIQDATSPSPWRYVNSEGNVADDASRGLTMDSIISKNHWINGPDFLWEPESRWPVQPVTQMSDDDPEIKRESQALLSLTKAGTNCINQVLEYFSSWYPLKKFVAWMLRYWEKLKQSSKRRKEGLAPVQGSPEDRSYDPLSIEEINKAEEEILKFIQRQSFPEELSWLDEQEEVNESNDLRSAQERKPQIKKSSAIYRLDPMKLGGLLYIGGRLRQASIPYPAKHQILLPNRHYVVDLIVRYYHLMSGHLGFEHVFSMVRGKFWILKARTAVRRVVIDCFDCKRRPAPLEKQKMADLPTDRVTPVKALITFVGFDCFGPLLVRRGRSLVKRYGVLFTCLSIRAIQLEVWTRIPLLTRCGGLLPEEVNPKK